MSRHRSVPSLFSGRFSLLALLVAGLLAWGRWKGWLLDPAKPQGQGPGRTGGTEARETVRKSGGWEEWHGCRLIEDRGNDGDSFVVERGDGQRAVVRLYFADCPEKARHQYNGPRIADQGRYFGGLTEEETVALGEEARDFTLPLLRRGSFRVLTRHEPVYDSARIYGFVEVMGDGDFGVDGVGKGDAGGRDLAELLVAGGLARIHTTGATRPGTGAGVSEKAEEQKLRALEKTAKRNAAGGWGLRGNN